MTGTILTIGDPDNPIAVGPYEVISEMLCIRALQLKGIRITESTEQKDETKAKNANDE